MPSLAQHLAYVARQCSVISLGAGRLFGSPCLLE